MVKSNELTVLLPQDLLNEVILFRIPCSEIVLNKSAGVSGVCVEAPECVVKVVVLDKLSHIGHPFKVRILHKAAPFTDKQRSLVLLMYIEPVVLPAVLHKAVKGIIALEPGLLVNCRTVVVGRVDQLVLILAQVDREVSDRSEVAAPPVKVIILLVGGGIITL